MKHSDQINELAAALSKAQGAMRAAKTNRTNPHFRSRYADLGAVIDASRQPLADNGLAVLMTIEPTDGAHVLYTKLVHASGQWVQSSLTVRPQKNDPQALGSALTYARRYAYSALIGVTSEDEDDDGNASMSDSGRARAQHDQVAPDKIASLTRQIEAAQNDADLVERVWPMIGQARLNAPEHDAVTAQFKARRRELKRDTEPGKGAESLLRRRQVTEESA